MKSLTVYRFHKSPVFEDRRLVLEARDPNGLWCVSMAKVHDIKQVTRGQDECDLSDTDEEE